MKADQKTYACTSMNEDKSKKSKVILWTAGKSVARGQKKRINKRKTEGWHRKNNNTTKSHNSLLRVHNIYLSTKAARVLLGSMKIKKSQNQDFVI